MELQATEKWSNGAAGNRAAVTQLTIAVVCFDGDGSDTSSGSAAAAETAAYIYAVGTHAVT